MVIAEVRIYLSQSLANDILEFVILSKLLQPFAPLQSLHFPGVLGHLLWVRDLDLVGLEGLAEPMSVLVFALTLA